MNKNNTEKTAQIAKNVEKLNKLRGLPRGTSVESRIAAIQDLLGEGEVFKTIQNLRWPNDIVCPRCHSTNVIRKDPPLESPDKRDYYECLNCQGKGGISDFDDLTGLPTDALFGDILGDIQRWILCWYLLGFCSLTQVAKILGLSVAQIMRMAELGTQLTEISPEAKATLEKGFFAKTPAEKARFDREQKQLQIADDELRSRSESRSPFKPGPKSQK